MGDTKAKGPHNVGKPIHRKVREDFSKPDEKTFDESSETLRNASIGVHRSDRSKGTDSAGKELDPKKTEKTTEPQIDPATGQPIPQIITNTDIKEAHKEAVSQEEIKHEAEKALKKLKNASTAEAGATILSGLQDPVLKSLETLMKNKRIDGTAFAAVLTPILYFFKLTKSATEAFKGLSQSQQEASLKTVKNAYDSRGVKMPREVAENYGKLADTMDAAKKASEAKPKAAAEIKKPKLTTEQQSEKNRQKLEENQKAANDGAAPKTQDPVGR
jgi:hypothetical protein